MQNPGDPKSGSCGKESMTSLGLESSSLTWLEWHDHISIIRKEMHVQILPLKPAPQIEYTKPSEIQNCIFGSWAPQKMHMW